MQRRRDPETLWLRGNTISSNGLKLVAQNFPEAVRKHVFDSEALLQANRYDGAGYLAGYAVECTLKTLISVEGGSVPWVHNLNTLSGKALQLQSLASQKTASYVSLPGITALLYRSPGWYETLRYEPEGTVSQADSTAWVSEARRLHDEVIFKMKLDGLIP
jgi:hypothetical protein